MPLKPRLFHSTALEDSNSAETITSQAALLSQGTKTASLTLAQTKTNEQTG